MVRIQSRLLITLVLLTSYTIQGYVLSEDDSTQDDLKSLLKDINKLQGKENMLREELQDIAEDDQSPNQFNLDLNRRLWEQSRAYRQVTEWFMKRYGNQGITFRPLPSCKESNTPKVLCKLKFDGISLRHVCREVYPITCM